MTKKLLIFSFIIILAGCHKPEQAPTERNFPVNPLVERDLEEIKEDGVLRAITSYSSTSYFLYRGRPMGFEYELLKRLADDWDLELEILVAHDIDELFGMLNRGEGDIIARGLTVTKPRKDYVAFTTPHITTHQALVQRKPEGWRNMKVHQIQQTLVQDPLELIGDTVHIQKNSSYHHRLENLSQEIGGDIHIDTVSPELSTDEIIRKVAQGEYSYTVADYNIAAMSQSYYPPLDIDVAMSLAQRIAWAVRKNSPQLKKAIDEWTVSMKQKVDYYVIYNRYFKSQKSYRTRIESEFFSENSDKISPYDQWAKQYTDSILGWDWRLVVSQMYQESHFDPNARSWVGARGLMQLMPGTARQMGVRNITDPEQNIYGGVKYLNVLWKEFADIPDSVQRVKFVMGAYNCGYAHVRDAQSLAKKYGGNPDLWDGVIEDYLIKLSSPKYYNDPVVKYGYTRGHQPYQYVRLIFERYKHYKQIVEQE